MDFGKLQLETLDIYILQFSVYQRAQLIKEINMSKIKTTHRKMF
jgi:hypothetical protein